MNATGQTLQILENVSLTPLTTLGVGGRARWFAAASNEQELQDAVQFASDKNLPIFVLGGGSNLLVSDSGFSGLVLHIVMQGKVVQPAAGAGLSFVEAAAGEDWDGLVQFTVERGLAGIECLAGIPGTVGGTPVQNVGAYGQEVSQTIRQVRCFDLQSRSFVERDHADCGFSYRTSSFNSSERGRYIVTRVRFELKVNGYPNLTYADLQRHFSAVPTPSLIETAEAVRSIRRTKGMVVDPSEPDSRSAGSFFKNPIVEREVLSRVAQAAAMTEQAVPHWPAGDSRVKLPAAWLLEQAGFVRGYVHGNAGISSKHTLALINRGGATARDITELRDRIVAGVNARFGVQLEQEPVNVS